jgi:hypothetical protein
MKTKHTPQEAMTRGEIEAWRHFGLAESIAKSVTRFLDAGGNASEMEFIGLIQRELREEFPLLGAQTNGLGGTLEKGLPDWANAEDPIRDAAQSVVDSWEGGDLAAAVRKLSAALDQ